MIRITPNVLYVPRAAWGASVTPLGWPVARNKRTEAIIHHVVAVDADATPNIWETQDECFHRMRGLQWCRPDLGDDVPYNFVVFLMADRTIIVCEGRGLDKTGAHTYGHNTVGIGIALYGDFRIQTNMVPYIRPLSHFLGWLKFDNAMVNLLTIMGHLDTGANTTCPGTIAYQILSDLRFLPYSKGENLSSNEYQELDGRLTGLQDWATAHSDLHNTVLDPTVRQHGNRLTRLAGRIGRQGKRITALVGRINRLWRRILRLERKQD